MPKIVLSYRRADSAAVAGRIFDHLVAHYGKDAVFMDIDNIPYGDDFRVHIGEALEATDALLVVVGPRWLDPDEETGAVRILEENDFVRVEIETALKKAIPVIPVLIDRTLMPKPAQLPESLKPFAFRNAADIDSGRDFQVHMERLLRSMDKSLAARRKPPAPATDVGLAASQIRIERVPGETAAASTPKPGPEAAPSSRTAPASAIDFRGEPRLSWRWIAWLAVTVVPMVASAATNPRDMVPGAVIPLAIAAVSGAAQSLIAARNIRRMIAFGIFAGTIWMLSVLLATAASGRSASAGELMLGLPVFVALMASVTMAGYGIGVLLRRWLRGSSAGQPKT
jgi:hypothetical protein